MEEEILQEKEIHFRCPYCREQISMLVDPSGGGGEYIEDCEVCCRPIQITYEVDDGEIADFVAVRSTD